MFAEPIATKIVYQISHADQCHILKEHFNFFYSILSANQLVPHAAFETVNGVKRCLSGIAESGFNAIIGFPETNWNECIEEQLSYFNAVKLPFVWYINEESNPEFKQKLLDYGFQDGGIFRSVIGLLDQLIASPEIPDDCVFELIQDEVALDEFNELVSTTFGIRGKNKDLYKQVLKNAANSHYCTMVHWAIRKQDKMVTAVSALIDGDIVSLWNLASLPEVRRQGLGSALCRVALRDALAKGCRIGISYLMSDGMALGICNQLGLQTKWQFNVFTAPLSTTRQEIE